MIDLWISGSLDPICWDGHGWRGWELEALEDCCYVNAVAAESLTRDGVGVCSKGRVGLGDSESWV